MSQSCDLHGPGDTGPREVELTQEQCNLRKQTTQLLPLKFTVHISIGTTYELYFFFANLPFSKFSHRTLFLRNMSYRMIINVPPQDLIMIRPPISVPVL